MFEEKRILLLDNYDSFTFNLKHTIEEVSSIPIDVFKNDEIGVEQVSIYSHIFLSPGPGLPDEAGRMKGILQKYYSSKKIFGVCLGLQAIAEIFGCTLKNLNRVFHGIKEQMEVVDSKSLIFQDIPQFFHAGRYHSWAVDKKSMTKELKISVENKEGEIMALEHKEFPVYGVQFHPESIMTPLGNKMIQNFLELEE